MDSLDYAFLNSNNEIINLCAIGKDDTETLNALKNLYGTTNVLVLDEVGHPSYFTDIWDSQNNKWIVTEIPEPVIFPTIISNEPNPYGEDESVVLN